MNEFFFWTQSLDNNHNIYHLGYRLLSTQKIWDARKIQNLRYEIDDIRIYGKKMGITDSSQNIEIFILDKRFFITVIPREKDMRDRQIPIVCYGILSNETPLDSGFMGQLDTFLGKISRHLSEGVWQELNLFLSELTASELIPHGTVREQFKELQTNISKLPHSQFYRRGANCIRRRTKTLKGFLESRICAFAQSLKIVKSHMNDQNEEASSKASKIDKNEGKK